MGNAVLKTGICFKEARLRREEARVARRREQVGFTREGVSEGVSNRSTILCGSIIFLLVLVRAPSPRAAGWLGVARSRIPPRHRGFPFFSHTKPPRPGVCPVASLPQGRHQLGPSGTCWSSWPCCVFRQRNGPSALPQIFQRRNT